MIVLKLALHLNQKNDEKSTFSIRNASYSKQLQQKQANKLLGV